MRDIEFRAWDGDKTKGYKMHGYQYRKAAYHPLATKRGYVLEHRLVVENHIGAYLPKHSIIHHKNHIRDDNRIENLEYMEEHSRHAKHHDTGVRNKNGQFAAECDKFKKKVFRLLNKNTGLMQELTLQKLISTTFRRSQFEYRGEFTGIEDSNGVKIFEGDKVSFSYGIPPVKVKAPVEFQDGCFFAVTKNHVPERCILSDLRKHVGDFWVDGDIYE